MAGARAHNHLKNMSAESNKPLVGIIMGSDSDLPVMHKAAEQLVEFDIAHEVTIVSAHRTPERMYDYARNAAARGLKVIIAGAGGAAHLPGMVASLTELPVIGVPIQSRAMSGTDSLYSIVQMPPGIPVATVAINGAKNAALLAARILAIEDAGVAKTLAACTQKQRAEVLAKAKELEGIGPEEYMKKQHD